jgi:hypothetical protein
VPPGASFPAWLVRLRTACYENLMSEAKVGVDWEPGYVMAFALFDSDYYLETYPDVRAAKKEPFKHYLTDGWRELRDPSPSFSTSYYLESYPDVAAAGVNPLVHYALAGAAEGRLARSYKPCTGKQPVLGAQSARQRSRHWAAVADADTPLPLDILKARVGVACAGTPNGILVSLSHDQYRDSIGGVQNCIAAEERALVAGGWAYVHLCPARPVPRLADPSPADRVALVLTLNGRREGVVLLSDLLLALKAAASGTGQSLHLAIHHFMGFAPGTVLELARICTAVAPIVWVHDFFSLCVNPILLRNDVAFCHAPPPESSACLVCCYGEERRAHLAAMASLFAELRPVVLAPSAVALDFWQRRSGLAHASAVVMQPARIEFGGLLARATGRRLRIAHLGAPMAHKGWPTFLKLLDRHADDPRYHFFRLGDGRTGVRGLTEVSVNVTRDKPDAMIDAVRTHAIDVAINWSNCFETFSFTALEAIAGGAFVLARADAGNVWPAVAAAGPGHGRGLRTEAELRALFISGEIIELAASSRSGGDLLRSSGTAELLQNGTSFG